MGLCQGKINSSDQGTQEVCQINQLWELQKLKEFWVQPEVETVESALRCHGCDDTDSKKPSCEGIRNRMKKCQGKQVAEVVGHMRYKHPAKRPDGTLLTYNLRDLRYDLKHLGRKYSESQGSLHTYYYLCNPHNRTCIAYRDLWHGENRINRVAAVATCCGLLFVPFLVGIYINFVLFVASRIIKIKIVLAFTASHWVQRQFWTQDPRTERTCQWGFCSSRGPSMGRLIFFPTPSTEDYRVEYGMMLPDFLMAFQPWGVPTWRSPAAKRERRRRHLRRESHALQPHRWCAKAKWHKKEGKRRKRRVRNQWKTRDRSVRCKIFFWSDAGNGWNLSWPANELPYLRPGMEYELSVNTPIWIRLELSCSCSSYCDKSTWIHSVGLDFSRMSMWSASLVSAPIHLKFATWCRQEGDRSHQWSKRRRSHGSHGSTDANEMLRHHHFICSVCSTQGTWTMKGPGARSIAPYTLQAINKTISLCLVEKDSSKRRYLIQLANCKECTMFDVWWRLMYDIAELSAQDH